MRPETHVRVDAEAPYDVVVGAGLLDGLAAALPESARRVGLVYAAPQQRIADQVTRAISGPDLEVVPIQVPPGEAAKTSEVASSCWRQLGLAGFTRSDAVVSVGGGATTDLAGFVAATFLRGLSVVHVPTTLLAMVDAAVGGKTGINTAEGKNLVGAFYEPTAVVCDLETLVTLPAAEMASGLAEVIKCGFIADPEILRLVEMEPAAAGDPRSPVLRQLLERSVTVKAVTVSADFREATSSGSAVGREALNYGHTLGHAVERVERYGIRHGAAVSIGMVYAAELASLAGRLSPEVVSRHREVLTSVGLPTAYDAAAFPALHDAMRVDKKARGDRLRFVVLAAVGSPQILEAPERELLEAAYRRISGRAG